MNNRKRELIEHLVRSIDYTKERILYWERLRTRESYDIFVRLNERDKENELVKVEYKDDICSFFRKNGKYVGTVEWLDYLASFGVRAIDNTSLYTFSELDNMGIDLRILEVIGNIHENPEFLEEK